MLCYGRLLITDLIFKNNMGLFSLSVSSCVSFASCVFQEFSPFNLVYQVCVHRLFYTFNVQKFGSDVISFISDTNNLCTLSFFLSLVRGALIFLILSKNQLLVALVFSIDFLF